MLTHDTCSKQKKAFSKKKIFVGLTEQNKSIGIVKMKSTKDVRTAFVYKKVQPHNS